jgi:glycosyltransferase involved in cell wall biosynthesis
MSRQTLSVLVNNFNYGDFVGAAVQSALDEGPDVEVIVVDDGSTDHSRTVIEAFGNRITAIFQENAGQAAAFNTGFAASSGEIIIFLDADDLLVPGAATAIREVFDDSAIAKLHWSLHEIDRDGRQTGALRPEALMPAGDLRARVVEHGPLGHSNPPTSGNAFARRALEQMMPMPEDDYRICADAYLVMLASIYGEVRRSLAPLSYWRRHGENRYNGTRETIAERVLADLDRYDVLAATLAVHLEMQGTRVRPELWQKRNIGYRRLDRVRMTLAEIEKVVPEGGMFVLVDDGDWTQGHLEGRELMPDRTAVRLFDGAILDEPPAEVTLLAEIKRLERAGATHVVFVWPGSWWLQHYPRFEAYLKSHAAPLGGGLLGYAFSGNAAKSAQPVGGRLSRDADLPTRRERLGELDRQINDLRTAASRLQSALESGDPAGSLPYAGRR